MGALINGEKSLAAQEDHADATVLTKTLWHCKQTCDQYADCVWFSWKMDGIGILDYIFFDLNNNVHCFRPRMQTDARLAR